MTDGRRQTAGCAGKIENRKLEIENSTSPLYPPAVRFVVHPRRVERYVMRLTKEEIRIIKEVVAEVVPGAAVYLFGSRVDDTKRGGDIDLFVLGEGEIGLEEEMKINSALQELLGEQKIDILCQRKEKLTAFGRLAMMDGVQL